MKFPWRSMFYLLVLSWLVLDLKFCHGPLKKKIAEIRPSSAITRAKALKLGWVALVNQQPIDQNQLELAVQRYLYQRGETEESVSEKSLLRIRRAALRGLIDDLLISQYADGDKFVAPQEEVDAFIKSWESQFATETELRNRSDWQELKEKDRNQELARIWSRKRWLEKRIAPGLGVTEAELKKWHELNPTIEPEKVRARHIFISTVEEDGEEQENAIREARRRIVEDEEEFAVVAREVSEDERTKERGGDLNWFSRERLSVEFTDVVFKQKTGELGEPFKTSIGWHIVEVTDRQEKREATFEETREEIEIHLLNEQRKDTVERLLGKYRKVANIIIFTENLSVKKEESE